MIERWCPECEVTYYYGSHCPTCGYAHPDDVDDE